MFPQVPVFIFPGVLYPVFFMVFLQGSVSLSLGFFILFLRILYSYPKVPVSQGSCFLVPAFLYPVFQYTVSCIPVYCILYSSILYPVFQYIVFQYTVSCIPVYCILYPVSLKISILISGFLFPYSQVPISFSYILYLIIFYSPFTHLNLIKKLKHQFNTKYINCRLNINCDMIPLHIRSSFY